MPQTDQVADEVAAPESQEDYERWRNEDAGDQTNVDKDPIQEDTAAAGKPAGTTVRVSETRKEKSGEDQEQHSPRVQKRFDQLTKAARDQERRANELARRLEEREAQDRQEPPRREVEKQAATTDKLKPKPDDFETYEDFSEALADWKVDQKLEARDRKNAQTRENYERQRRQEHAEHAHRETVNKFVERRDVGKANYPDFDEVLESGNLENMPPAMVDAVQDSEYTADVIYWLATHPGEAAAISRLSPLAAIREIGIIEAPFRAASKASPEKSSPQPKPKVSSAPAPISPVRSSGSAAVNKDPSNMSLTEYERWRSSGGGGE